MKSITKTGVFTSLGVLPLLPLAGFPPAEITLTNIILEHRDGNKNPYRVEVADTRDQWTKGLSHRRALPSDHGMLFDFKQSKIAKFWMHDTYIPLDVLFIQEDGIIRQIEHAAEPLNDYIFSSKMLVRYILEINGGQCKEKHIEVGDRLNDVKSAIPQ